MALHLQVLFLLGTASLLHARCPAVPVIADFDPSRFAGKWFQVEWLNTGRIARTFARTTRCLEVTFTETGNGSFSANLKWKFQLGNFFVPTSLNTMFYRQGANVPSYFETTRSIFGLPLPMTPIYVLETDYNKYAIIYSCVYVGLGIRPVEMSWILHRKRIGLTNRRRRNIFDDFPGNGITFIDTARYNRVDNSDCVEDGPTGNTTTPA